MNNYNVSYTTPTTPTYKQPGSYITQYVQNPTWPNQVYNNMTPVMSNQNYQQNVQANNSIIWVQGENAAKSYPVAPNTAIALWDSEQQTIYIKSVDSNGIPSLKVLDYIDRDNEIVQSDNTNEINYVTQDQMNDFSEQIKQQMADLQKKLNDFKSRMGNLNSKEKKDGKSTV